MSLTIRLNSGIETLTADELAAKAKEIVAACPSEITNVYRVWYEGLGGCGVPVAKVYDAIAKGIEAAGWTSAGKVRFEKFGVVDAWRNENYANAPKEINGNPMVLHKFHQGAKYQGPDGKVYWIPVMEVFDLRAFEWKDGVCVGEMVEIDPNSDYAKAMVEVK